MKLAESINDPRFLLGFATCLSTALSETILGSWRQTDRGIWYIAYEGIPYAKPPVDHLRFEPPETNLLWPSRGRTLIAREVGSVCMQYDPVRDNVTGSENCLFMNVYRPDPETAAKNNPVIFYIHGPDFQTGSGGIHQAKHLLNSPVILVTFNYRLGALGFLSTEDDVVPGNMGLKDQVHALLWVNRYIDNFGGDPNQITIIGQGAGGASVHYHYFSTRTFTLFKQGMSMSGTALSPWAMAERSLEKAKKLGRMVRCTQPRHRELINCLKRTSANEIILVSLKFKTYKNAPFAPFAPVVEGQSKTALIVETPMNKMLSGRVHDRPWITGIVAAEGLGFIADVVAKQREIQNMGEKWETIAPDLLDFTYTLSPWRHARTANWIRKEYVGPWSFVPSTIISTLLMVSDRMVTNGAVLAASLHARNTNSPVRFYRFQYRGLRSFTEKTTGSLSDFGVAPGDDLAYIFDLDINLSFQPGDRKMRRMMVDWWVSYAHSNDGKPSVGTSWPPLSSNHEDAVLLSILNPTLMITTPLKNEGRIDFWQSLHIQEESLLEDPNRPRLTAEQTFWFENHVEPCNVTENVN